MDIGSFVCHILLGFQPRRDFRLLNKDFGAFFGKSLVDYKYNLIVTSVIWVKLVLSRVKAKTNSYENLNQKKKIWEQLKKTYLP